MNIKNNESETYKLITANKMLRSDTIKTNMKQIIRINLKLVKYRYGNKEYRN